MSKYRLLTVPVGGGTNTSDATAQPDDILSGKTAYNADGKIEGTILTVGNDDITVERLNVTIPSGYIAEQMTVEANPNLKSETVTPTRTQMTINTPSGYDGLSSVTVQGYTPNNTNVEVTPTTAEQSVSTPEGYDGISNVTVAAVTAEIDANITADNIKKDVEILGVTGTLEEGITPSGELAISENGTYDVTEYASAIVDVQGGEELPDSEIVFYGNTQYNNRFTLFTNYYRFKNGRYSSDGENWIYFDTATDGWSVLSSTEYSKNLAIGEEFHLMYSDILTVYETKLWTISYYSKVNIKGDIYNKPSYIGSGGDFTEFNIHIYGERNEIYQLLNYMSFTIDKQPNLIFHTNTLRYNCCCYLFQNKNALITAPDLPATNLGALCYYSMFSDCRALTTAPALPATNLGAGCYYYMFSGCTSLTTAPALPATTLKHSCYYYMFKDCTSLTTAPDLQATNLGTSCYNSMFQGCTSLTETPDLPATTLTPTCYQGMFQGCTSLTETPDLPATTLTPSCYQGMFQGCTSLTETPDLPATNLGAGCYYNMFSGCTSLQKTGEIAAKGSISSYVSNMFSGCTSLRETTWTATTPPTINSNTFSNCPSDMVIYVPDESVDAYKAASIWSSRAAYIKGISEKPTA